MINAKKTNGTPRIRKTEDIGLSNAVRGRRHVWTNFSSVVASYILWTPKQYTMSNVQDKPS